MLVSPTMSPHRRAVDLVVCDAQVMRADGSFAVAQVAVTGGRIVTLASAGTAIPVSAETVVVDGAGLWLMAGIVDCHTHLGWTTFLHDDAGDGPGTEGDPRGRRRAQVAPALAATLAAGVTSARDAGGLEAELREDVEAGLLPGPRMVIAVEILTAERRGEAGWPREHVRRLTGRGADWIKLMATGGVMAPEGTELESAFTEAEIVAVVDEARAAGVRVMVHAWGGAAITHAVAAGAASIEHGIFLTAEQAKAGAARGTVLVPTLAIYAEVLQMAEDGELPASVLERTRRVVAAHPAAVRTAQEAGMRVALGSDFGTSAQHGRNLVEIDHLARAGLGGLGALLAATRNGAQLLGTGSGLLEVGAVFDAVLLDGDPRQTEIFHRPEAVVGVFLGGTRVR